MALTDEKTVDTIVNEEEKMTNVSDDIAVKNEIEEVKEEVKVENKPPVVQEDDDITDIEIAPIKRKKFRLNGDPNKIIALNMSDLGLYTRLEKGYAELRQIASEIADVDFDPVNDDVETLHKAMDILDTLNTAMKEKIDYIFDAEVAEKAADGGTMYDPHNGVLRYEYIIETLLKLYDSNISNEFKLMQKKMSKHTAKYVAPNNRAGRRAQAKKK